MMHCVCLFVYLIHGFFGVPICHALSLPVLAGALIAAMMQMTLSIQKMELAKGCLSSLPCRGIACDCLQSVVLCGSGLCFRFLRDFPGDPTILT